MSDQNKVTDSEESTSNLNFEEEAVAQNMDALMGTINTLTQENTVSIDEHQTHKLCLKKMQQSHHMETKYMTVDKERTLAYAECRSLLYCEPESKALDDVEVTGTLRYAKFAL